jgi:hypothetical protein
MKIDVSTCHILPHFLIPLSFHALEKAKNAFLPTIIIRGSTKLAMSTFKMVKNEGVATISSIHNMSSILTGFEQQG